MRREGIQEERTTRENAQSNFRNGESLGSEIEGTKITGKVIGGYESREERGKGAKTLRILYICVKTTLSTYIKRYITLPTVEDIFGRHFQEIQI